MISKILCATDGVEHSNPAITLAAQLASKFGARLSVISVNVMVHGGKGPTYNLWTEEEFDKVLSNAKTAVRQAGVPAVETVKAYGRDAAAVIVDYAEKNDFDHIVVGTPRTGVSRLILGSVAAEVAAKAHCPVTVSR